MDKNFIVSLDTQSFDNEMSICPVLNSKIKSIVQHIKLYKIIKNK